MPDGRVSSLLNLLLNRIHRVGRPSSVYAFVMNLMEAHRTGGVSESSAADVLKSLESFLFRRAVMGIEPTGLHAAFKGLWNELTKTHGPASITGAGFKMAVSAKPTITWPTDSQFLDAIQTQDLYHRKVVQFALREHELSLEGETPDERFFVEHIAPQTATEHWKSAFGDEHEKLVHTWGNLIPLSSEMNPAVGQKPFSAKKEAFANSKFANARHVALSHDEWTPSSIRKRNVEIGKWALSRWQF